jgi:hypothetical protein
VLYHRKRSNAEDDGQSDEIDKVEYEDLPPDADGEQEEHIPTG